MRYDAFASTTRLPCHSRQFAWLTALPARQVLVVWEDDESEDEDDA